jgi:nucleotidyltransferase substrate binding protein (TIGR01987 family)
VTKPAVDFEIAVFRTPIILVSVNPDIRWKQRFENYEKALRLLREALDDVGSLSDLEKQGTIQRFEFTVELAWKTMKDYLEFSGVVLSEKSPKSVVKQAFTAKIITDGQLWVDMLDFRNALTHQYDRDVFDRAVHEMADRFLHGLDELYAFLKQRSAT